MAINADALKILLNLNGADTSTTITDSSSYSTTITNNQGSYGFNSTDTSKFGSASGKFLNTRLSHTAVDVTYDTGTLETSNIIVYDIILPVGTVIYNATRDKYAVVYDFGTTEVDIGSTPTNVSWFKITPDITGQDAGDVIYYGGSDIRIPNTNVSFNEDFSISFWIKAGASGGIILDTRSSLDDSNNFFLTLEDDDTLSVRYNTNSTKGSTSGKVGTSILSTTTAISTSVFDYVKIGRKAGVFGIYINKVLEDSTDDAFEWFNFNFNTESYTNDLIPTMTSNTTPSGIASARTEFSSTYAAWKAMDDNTTTFWSTTTGGVTPCWLEYQFTSSVIIEKYTITARDDANDGSPNTWTFEGYNGSSWDTLDTQSSITFTNGEKKQYTFSNSTAYTRYRINISANNGRSTTNIAELEMMEQSPSNSNIQLGNVVGGNGAGFNGYIDEVQIWDGMSKNNYQSDILTLDSAEYSSDDVDIEISNIVMQTEFEETNIEVSNLVLQTEFEETNIEVSNLVLQVEFDPDTIISTSVSAIFEVLEFQETDTMEASTTTTTVNATAHALVAEDMIVNTTRRGVDAERGSRRVLTASTDSFTVAAMTGQTSGDSFRKYKYIDRTDLVKVQTLNANLGTQGSRTLNLTIITDKDYIPQVGQYCRFGVTQSSYTRYFLGRIQTTNVRLLSNSVTADANDTLLVDIQAMSLNTVPAYRTIEVAYDLGEDLGDIVQDMVDTYLIGDGISAGTIDTGSKLDDDWYDDVISIGDVLDRCAKESGYVWFVDEYGALNFYEEPSTFPTATNNIDTTSDTFTDYRNVRVSTELGQYLNKYFVLGGYDERGNPVIVSSEDFDESTAMQEVCGGTGVYGQTMRDSGITGSAYVTSAAGTTTTNITYTAHGQEVGDMVWNLTRNEYRLVTTVVDADNFTVASVTSQTAGDIIVFFDKTNDIIKNAFKVSGRIPKTVTFQTATLDFNAGEKITINIPEMGISNETYYISNVRINDYVGIQGSETNGWLLQVTCIIRDNANFSIQRLNNYQDFWDNF